MKALCARRHPSARGEWMSWPEVFGIDVFAVGFWGQAAGQRVAYEVKVSRSDLLSELRRPEKRAAAVEITHRFYFATPKGLVRPGELPGECGLVECHNGRSRAVVPAPVRDPRPLREDEWLYLLRRDLFRNNRAALERRVSLLEFSHQLLRRRVEDYQGLLEAAAG